MINLTRGVPAPESFALDGFVEAFKAAMLEDGRTAMSYVATPGYKPLIDWIAKEENVTPDQILIGNGSLECLNFIATVAAEPGDCVFMESPSYDRANLIMKRRGLNPCGIPLLTDGVDLNVFEEMLKKHTPKFFYTIPDFQNPMGTTTSLEKERRLLNSLSNTVFGFWKMFLIVRCVIQAKIFLRLLQWHRIVSLR
jgi:DNA-binding transcriptional MocR family regulator